MKKILIFLIVPVISGAVIFCWNISQKKIVITTPTVNQSVGMEFTLKGTVSSTLLKDATLGIELKDENGNLILGQLIEVSAPWWSRFISIPIYFETQIDTSGITSETPTCFGVATLIVGSLKHEQYTHFVRVNCTAKQQKVE